MSLKPISPRSRNISYYLIVAIMTIFWKTSIGHDLHLDEGPMLDGQPTIEELRTIPGCMAVAKKVYSDRGISAAELSDLENVYQTNYENITGLYSHGVKFPDWNIGYREGLEKMEGFTSSEIDRSELGKVCSDNMDKMRKFINFLAQ